MSDNAQRIAELERRVAELSAQNAEAARELDAFVYAVSHDLRAPLRSLSGFSQALLESADADPVKQRHYLERIQQASRKLSELIDALLALSRVARAELHPREVDLSQLVADVAAEVAAKFPGRHIALNIAPHLSAFGDARLLKTALEHLLENAFKFTQPVPAPRIDVGRDAEGRYFIADNGVGFDAAYADKLFKPFQRLHGEQKFAGLGIGLAIVHRIFARHRGGVTIEGKDQVGATVSFWLPERAEPQGTPQSASS